MAWHSKGSSAVWLRIEKSASGAYNSFAHNPMGDLMNFITTARNVLASLAVASLASCGSSSSGSSGGGTTDSAEYTALKTVFASKCTNCHTHTHNAWTTSEASFKSSLSTIQAYVKATGSSAMPPAGSPALTTAELAQFTNYTGK